MTELRRGRRELQLTQAELARELGVPLNSLRMWDSGLRPTPSLVVERVRTLSEAAARDRQLLTLPQLAESLHVHVRTLQAAARTGRLEVGYETRSVFGRPLRFATRAAGRAFLETHYRRYGGQRRGSLPVPAAVPADYQLRLRTLRRGLHLSQSDLAELVGAANKAVVYQWESGKRNPSPVFWEPRLPAPPSGLPTARSCSLRATLWKATSGLHRWRFVQRTNTAWLHASVPPVRGEPPNYRFQRTVRCAARR